MRDSDVQGGLCVQVGAQSTAWAARLAATGRFLVQILDARPAAVAQSRNALQARGVYGLVSVDGLPTDGTLPYAENLVNLLLVERGCPQRVPPAEAARVLRPGGLLLVQDKLPDEASVAVAGLKPVSLRVPDGGWTAFQKPWPPEMDQWPHPRHAADGNAVSRDAQVAPPRRIRWVVGAVQENSRLVSAAGRNFYADVLARDAFNGLRLWQQPIGSIPNAPAPGVGGSLLFAVSQKKLIALDVASGAPVREYPAAESPKEILYAGGTLIAVDAAAVRAIRPDTGRLLWTHEAAEPQCAVAGDGAVFLLQGSLRRGEKCVAVSLELASGKLRWKQDQYDWTPKVRRLVYHDGLLACEVSTLNNDGPGNVLYVLSAADGRLLWSREFSPGMNHVKQARAMFSGDLLWVLERNKCVALEPKTGEVKRTFPAGYCHCFPPVATPRYMLAGEMELTSLDTGDLDANRITKAACGRDAGWVPANGLIYVCPKHCVCWPMLRGYAALAGALAGSPGERPVEQLDFMLEKGVETPAAAPAAGAAPEDWPCYRHDPWRSAGTPAQLPPRLRTLWKTSLGAWPEGPITDDWRENPFVRGPVSAPVIAGGRVFVARPDAHQVVALDARSGKPRWRYTANGRVDTPPTVHRGLCLFGTKSGWVYCLRADDGQLVWRLRAAPAAQQIVAYGQIESPWPVPGSLLVIDDVAYFAAGRQSLADGGILVFAVEPATGAVRWVRRLDTIPFTNFYTSSALEFDNFDLLQQEGRGVAMSRWVFDRADGHMTCKAAEAFALLEMGDSGVIVPRGCWSYAPRHQSRHVKPWFTTRPPVAFRDGTLLGCTEDRRSVYRRDFDPAAIKEFNRTWITGWAASDKQRKQSGGSWQSQRLAEYARWTSEVLPKTQSDQAIVALLLAGQTLFAAGSEGGLTAVAAEDGRIVQRLDLPAPVWDGMAAGAGRLVVATRDGDVVCLGDRD